MNAPNSAPKDANAGVLAVAAVLAGVINFAYSLSMTHGLSQHDYSVFAAGQSLLLVSGTLAIAAIPWVLAQELVLAAGDRQRRRAAIRFALEVNLLGGVIAAGLVGLFSLGFTIWPTAGVLALGTLLLVIGSTGAGYLQGDGRMAAVAAIGLAEFSAKAGFGVVAVFLLGAGINAALGAAAFGAALLTLIGLLFMRGEFGWSRPTPPNAHLWGSAARVGPRPLLNMTTAGQPDSPWLFPGQAPAQHVQAKQLSARLARDGVRSSVTRQAALTALAAEIPAPVLAEALGFHPRTLIQRAGELGLDWAGYAATKTRSSSS